MKYADDTGFYCYRAIEALRHHCSATHALLAKSKDVQWEKFREISGVDIQAIEILKNAAGEVRHGGVTNVTSEDREKFFETTWNIVGSYLSKI